MNGKRAAQGMSRRDVRGMRRDRRDFLTIMGGAGAALMAAACGGSSTSKPSGAATSLATRAAASTSTSAAAAVRTTPAASSKVSTVAYFDSDNAPAEVDWHKQFAADFQAAFPQYHAEASHFTTADLIVKLQTAVASNSPPDLLYRDGRALLPTFWEQGLLAPVNDVMDDVYKLAGGKDKVVGVERYTTATGDVFGVPYAGIPYVWWFRQDLLQQAGLTPPAGHWDWNFLLKAAKAIHNPPNVYGVGLPLGRNPGIENTLGALILGNGGHFVSPDLKDVVFDSPEVRDAVDVAKELAQYAPPDATSWALNETVTALVKGFVGMAVYSGRPFTAIVAQNPALVGKMSNSLVPYNKAPSSFSGMGAHGVFKAKNVQGAKELAKFTLNKEQMISYVLVTAGANVPAVTAYLDDPSYTGSAILKQYDPKMVATMTEATKYYGDFFKEGPAWKNNPKSGTLSASNFLIDVLQKVTVGKESTQSAVTWGAQQIRDIMMG
jgi:multiple sugar transport system substrate-binding protein